MTLVFKKFSHHRINGNKLEFIGEGEIQELYEQYNDNDYYLNEAGDKAHDANGNVIWETGETMIDSGDCWYYYSTEIEDYSELTENEKYAFATDDHFETIDRLQLLGFSIEESNIAKEDNKIHEFIHGSYDLEDYEEVTDEDDYDISYYENNDWKYYNKI